MVNRISSAGKVKRLLGTPKRWPHIFPRTCFQDRLGDVLRTSSERPESISLRLPLDIRLGTPLDVISRRPQDVKLGGPWVVNSRRLQDGHIGSLGNVLGEGRLGTFWRPIFATWVRPYLEWKTKIIINQELRSWFFSEDHKSHFKEKCAFHSQITSSVLLHTVTQWNGYENKTTSTRLL